MSFPDRLKLLGIVVLLAGLFSTNLSAEEPGGAPQPENKGQYIRSVNIEVKDIFEGDNLSTLYTTANSLKINTQKQVVERELLFKVGDTFDKFVLEESERRLRDLRYLRKAHITYTSDGDAIDVQVVVQDTWTIIPSIGFSSGTGRKSRSAGFTESNLLGLAKRVEFSYEEDEAREILEGVYEDQHFWDTNNRFLGALFSRSDGEQGYLYYGLPFRTLVDKKSVYFNSYGADIVGRLFEDGDESYIFRRNDIDLSTRYTLAYGNPEKLVRRYSAGFAFLQSQFEQADQDDYDDLELDPDEVSNDPALLPPDRRFVGPLIAYEHITPEYISMNYIDRFDRVEDYNLGDVYSATFQIAPEFLGSNDDYALFSFNKSRGRRFDRGSFLRGEVGYSGRVSADAFENSLLRGELKYYDVLGELYFKDLFLGKHTLAASFSADYGDELDRDRQFLAGGDNALRGYKARAFAGDKRAVINLEDRVHLIDDLYKLVSVGAAVFFDAGGATYDAMYDIFGDDLYADVGVGLRFAFPRSSGGRVLRIDLALPLRAADEGSNRFELRIIATGGQLFNSQLRSETVGPEQANVAVGFDR